MSAPKVESECCSCDLWKLFISLVCREKEKDPVTEKAKEILDEKRKHEQAFKPGHGKHFSQDNLSILDMMKWGNFISKEIS